MTARDPLIVALDFESAAEARALMSALGAGASFYKVGMELYAAAGPDFVRELTGLGNNVFVDLKYFDIGETVKRATAQIARLGATFLTVHSSVQVMRAALEGRGDSGLKILAVTVLTSFDEGDLRDLGYDRSMREMVALRTQKALACGVDGVITSPHEAAVIREQAGPQLLIVAPGVRSPGASVGDQKRVATPAAAMRAGADYLVIGRQITRAADPVAALRELRAELA